MGLVTGARSVRERRTISYRVNGWSALTPAVLRLGFGGQRRSDVCQPPGVIDCHE